MPNFSVYKKRKNDKEWIGTIQFNINAKDWDEATDYLTKLAKTINGLGGGYSVSAKEYKQE